jgi:23S rRNA (adenine2503-C2)-methyltransferase
VYLNDKDMENIKVPTGNILIVDGDRGKLECLSIGDYGKEKNIKADFLGLTKEIDGVPNGNVRPLSEKWVITISSQYGCSMGCTFCDVPKVGPGRNASKHDLTLQVIEALKLHPEIGSTKRLNIHYARMGEPTFNNNVLSHAIELMREVRPFVGRSHVHPVVSTMMPMANKNLITFLQQWCDIKNYNYRGAAGLQLSINSTNENQRKEMFNGSSLDLEEISEICKILPDPVGRKYALNFALADYYTVNAPKLRRLFHPSKFMVKITPMHLTNACLENDIKTNCGYSEYTPYQETESELKNEGFDVLVFIPSIEEDESRITCGNAILSDKRS